MSRRNIRIVLIAILGFPGAEPCRLLAAPMIQTKVIGIPGTTLAIERVLPAAFVPAGGALALTAVGPAAPLSDSALPVEQAGVRQPTAAQAWESSSLQFDWAARAPGAQLADPVIGIPAGNWESLAPPGPPDAKLYAEVETELQRLGPTPAPRMGLWRAGVLAYGTTLIAAPAALLYLRSPQPEIFQFLTLAYGASFAGLSVLRGAISLFGKVYRGMRAPPAQHTPAPAAMNGFIERVESLARNSGVPPPSKVEIWREPGLNASVTSPLNGSYELHVTPAILELPEAMQEAVVRHELAHVRHRDGLWRRLRRFVVPAAPLIGFVAAGMGAGPIPLLVSAAGAVWGHLAWERMEEYLADQRAAHGMGGPATLIRFLMMADPRKDLTAVAVFGFAAPAAGLLEELGFGHSSPNRRIARLARLSK